MGLLLLFDRFSDIQARVEIGSVRQAGDTPGYDADVAVVPAEDWHLSAGQRPNICGLLPVPRPAW